MKKTIITSLFQDEAITEITNLLNKIKISLKNKKKISNLNGTWDKTNPNLVIIKYKNKDKLKKISITITDFEITIESKETEDVTNVEITIKKHLNKVQKYFV